MHSGIPVLAMNDSELIKALWVAQPGFKINLWLVRLRLWFVPLVWNTHTAESEILEHQISDIDTISLHGSI